MEQIKTAQTWEERYRLIIQAGKNLAKPSESELAQMQEIHGCEARLWFSAEPIAEKNAEKNSRPFAFKAYSEARIMNGLLWLLLNEINGKTAPELAKFDISAFFAHFGIAQRLSQTRLNGLKQIECLLHSL